MCYELGKERRSKTAILQRRKGPILELGPHNFFFFFFFWSPSNIPLSFFSLQLPFPFFFFFSLLFSFFFISSDRLTGTVSICDYFLFYIPVIMVYAPLPIIPSLSINMLIPGFLWQPHSNFRGRRYRRKRRKCTSICFRWCYRSR